MPSRPRPCRWTTARRRTCSKRSTYSFATIVVLASAVASAVIVLTKVSALGVEEQRVNVIAGIDSPREAWSRLGDGYRVEARFIVWEGSDVVQIPSSAVFHTDEGAAVFTARDGRARLRQVSVGRASGTSAEIAAGVEPGEQVIVHPDDRLTDGSRIEVAER